LDFALARTAMIETQVRPNDVTDRRVLAALSSVAKEAFLPDALKPVAYADCTLQVAPGRSLFTGRDLARLLQAAEIEETDRILDVATGVGYSTAVLAQLGRDVTALETGDALAAAVRERLAANGVQAEVAATPDLRSGWAGKAPYDVIWVNGAVEVVPRAWLDQLADGGRLAVVVREGAVSRATVYRKSGAAIASRTPFEAAAPVLPGFERAVDFQF
jgi:protein-L-isoaspartate(D-aspartate) O-methyltransferase